MEIIFAPVDLIHVCEILKLLYSDMGKKLNGTENIRKVLTSLRRIVSKSLRAKGRTRRWAQKQKRRCLKGLVHQEGKSE